MAFQYNNQIKIDLKHLLSSLSYSLLMRFSGTFEFFFFFLGGGFSIETWYTPPPSPPLCSN